jgi:hypothetical protein
MGDIGGTFQHVNLRCYCGYGNDSPVLIHSICVWYQQCICELLRYSVHGNLHPDVIFDCLDVHSHEDFDCVEDWSDYDLLWRLDPQYLYFDIYFLASHSRHYHSILPWTDNPKCSHSCLQ